MATSDWKCQYLASLQTRDALEQADRPLYDRITAALDRNAHLEAQALQNQGTSAVVSTVDEGESIPHVPAPLVSYGWRRSTTSPVSGSSVPAKGSVVLLDIRTEFSKAQQERVELQAKLEALTEEHNHVRAQASKVEQKLQAQANRERQLATRLRDREEELKGKSKLLTDVQDENAALDLELNVADQQITALKRENQELVDRWMVRMGHEADEMNKAGKFE